MLALLPLLVAVLGAQGCGTVPLRAQPSDPAGNFFEVSPGLYRGGRLDQLGMTQLQELGVRTVVNLEDAMDLVTTEQGWAESCGLDFVSAPMNGLETPSDVAINRALSTMADPKKGPVYVHCMKGQDRTGLVIALYRVLHEGWQPADAWKEMMDLGFNSLLFPLKDYFEQRTGWND